MLRRAFLFVTLLASITVLAQTLQAQARPSYRADIPFDFSVSDHPMPAGTYHIVPLSQHELRLENKDRRTVANLMVYPTTYAASVPCGQLRFHKAGHGYFLVEFSAPDTGPGIHTGSKLMLSARERSVENEVAESNTPMDGRIMEVAVNTLP